MPDGRSPVQHHLMLARLDPEQGAARSSVSTCARAITASKNTVHLLGVFELGINPGTPDGPLLVKITVQRYTTDEGAACSSPHIPVPRRL